tara:strand:- start:47000 stop:47389 length:390 start_codon:yes stop_codon:yes gene_type:complete
MSDLSTTLTDKEIQQIAEKDDFHIAPYRADGETFGTPTWIWVVETDGELFVRAYNGISSRWYQSAKEQKAGKIEAAGMKKKVRFELISDHKLNEKIDEAYRKKYSSSPYLNSMIRSRAKAATVRILPGE